MDPHNPWFTTSHPNPLNQFGEASSSPWTFGYNGEIGTQGSKNFSDNYFSSSGYNVEASNSFPANNVNNVGVSIGIGQPGSVYESIFGTSNFGETISGSRGNGQFQQNIYTSAVNETFCENGGVPKYFCSTGNDVNFGGKDVEDDEDDDDDDSDYVEESDEDEQEEDYVNQEVMDDAIHDEEALKYFNKYMDLCGSPRTIRKKLQHSGVPDLRRFDRGEEDDEPGSQSRDRWIIAGKSTFEPPPRQPDEYIDPTDDTPLAIGSIFPTKYELQHKVTIYHLENKRGCKVLRSDPDRVWLKCNDKQCHFKLRASGTSSLWRIYKLVEHTCQFNPTRGAPHTLPSKFLGKILAEKIVVKGQIMIPEAIRAMLRADYTLQVNYAFARRIRNHAISTLYGNEDESFKMIPSYLFMLRQMNPGTVTDYMVDPHTGQFMYAFYALGVSIAGFSHARPFIVIDGTHLKSKYRGIMFVAATKDGNNQIFPLAFGLGGVESRESWTWFLQRVRGAFCCPAGMLIVSDGSPAIARAISDVFPESHHGLCCYHIQKNLARYGKNAVNLFKVAAYSYRVSDYNRHMTDLEETCLPAYRHLKEEVGETRWARVHCPVRRYDIMTSNVAESLNSALLWARRLPVCSVLEVSRSLMEDWFSSRYKSAVESNGPLTEYATEKLLTAMNQGDGLKVSYRSETRYKVRHRQKDYTVVLSQQACECEKYQHDMIPCLHASAVIRHIKHDPTAYVAGCFKVDHLRTMWSGCIGVVPHPDQWMVPGDIRNVVCERPNNPRQAGRPRERRIPFGPERSTRPRRVQKCRRCNGTGHNTATCTVEIPQGLERNEAGVSPTQRAPKKCRICGIEGHTAPTCPRRRGFDMNRPLN